MRKLSRNFKQRLYFSIIGTPILLGVIYTSHCPGCEWLFAAILAVLISTAQWEFYHITTSRGWQPVTYLGIATTVAYVFVTLLITKHPNDALWTSIPKVLFILLLLLSFVKYFFRREEPIVNLSLTFFGILYLAVPLSYMIDINYFFSHDNLNDGRWWLIYLIGVTKMTDIGAYLVGKLMGTKKLAPYISPGKTAEGALGGLLAAVLTSMGFYFLSTMFYGIALQLALIESLLLGLMIGILAQIGDLSESLIKRDFGVKDSNQLPGIGGILDLLDSLIFTVPFFYIYLELFRT